MPNKKAEQIIEPIAADLNVVSKAVVKSKPQPAKSGGSNMPVKEPQKPPKAMHWGKLPIGQLELDCVVLDNGMRVLTAKSIFEAFGRARKGMNSRLEIDGTNLPPFIAAQNLKPFINQQLIERTTLVSYLDGARVKTGYVAGLLPLMCNLYLVARRNNKLVPSQEKLAAQSEIISSALALVGIDALVDEATGYQLVRGHDALRMLLSKYIAEGLQQWILTFPNSFFAELPPDCECGHERRPSSEAPSSKRPATLAPFNQAGQIVGAVQCRARSPAAPRRSTASRAGCPMPRPSTCSSLAGCSRTLRHPQAR